MADIIFKIRSRKHSFLISVIFHAFKGPCLCDDSHTTLFKYSIFLSESSSNMGSHCSCRCQRSRPTSSNLLSRLGKQWVEKLRGHRVPDGMFNSNFSPYFSYSNYSFLRRLMQKPLRTLSSIFHMMSSINVRGN